MVITKVRAIKTKRSSNSNFFSSVIISWLELGDGNITFVDELDFAIAELYFVYEDSEND